MFKAHLLGQIRMEMLLVSYDYGSYTIIEAVFPLSLNWLGVECGKLKTLFPHLPYLYALAYTLNLWFDVISDHKAQKNIPNLLFYLM